MGFALAIIAIIYLGIIGLMISSMWKIYTKANQPGWACLVPIYSLIVLLDIIKKPGIWFLWLIIPFVNIVFLVKINLELAKVFGKSSGFGIGLLLVPFVFYPMLGFGDAVYMQGDSNFDEFGKPVANPNFENQAK